MPLMRSLLVMAGVLLFGAIGCAQVTPPPAPQTTWEAPPPPQRVVRPAPRTCTPAHPYRRSGLASWYGRPYHGRRTASGQVYDMYRMTAAHRSLPFGSRIRVTNMRNGRSVVLTVNDRGPFVRRRIVDVSYRAARELGFARRGLARVRVEQVQRCRGRTAQRSEPALTQR